jgi:hypothetical protein
MRWSQFDGGGQGPLASTRGAATAEARIARPNPLVKTPTIRRLDITAPDVSRRSEATTRAPKVAMWSSHIAVKLIGHNAKRFKNGNPGQKDTTAANAAQPMTAPPRANPMQKTQRPSLAEIKRRPRRKTRIILRRMFTSPFRLKFFFRTDAKPMPRITSGFWKSSQGSPLCDRDIPCSVLRSPEEMVMIP